MNTDDGRSVVAGVAVGFALLTAACDGRPAGTTMEVELQFFDRRPDVLLEIEDQEQTRTFDRSDLSHESQFRLTTGDFAVAERGRIRVRLRLSDDKGPLAEAAVEIEAFEDMDWDVNAAVTDLVFDPSSCTFCPKGIAVFPVAERFRSSPADSLKIWWRGLPLRPDLGL